MNDSRERTRGAIAFLSDGDFAIHVTDIEKAEDFYGDVLGFKLLEKKNDQLVYDTGQFTLYVNKDTKVIPYIPALAVKNFDKAKQHLTGSGCKIVKEWPKHKALYFEDPFGILFDIIEK